MDYWAILQEKGCGKKNIKNIQGEKQYIFD